MDIDIYQIGVAIMAIFGAAQAVARLTPTPKDDLVVSKIGKFFNILLSATRIKKP